MPRSGYGLRTQPIRESAIRAGRVSQTGTTATTGSSPASVARSITCSSIDRPSISASCFRPPKRRPSPAARITAPIVPLISA